MSVAEIDRTAGTKVWLTRSSRVDDETFAISLPFVTDQLPVDIGVGANTTLKFETVWK